MTDTERVRILAVEDNPDTQTLLRYLLRDFDVNLVPHVDDALRIAASDDFDVFLLDINLGERQTGIDLLQKLRAMGQHRQTPALAVTAYAMPGDRERFMKAGFDAYVSKPFTRNELLETIYVLLHAHSQDD